MLPPLEKQFEQTRDLIRALVGNLPNQEIAETFELASLKLPPKLPLSLPSKIIEQRPDVRAAEEQLRSANAEVGVAIAAMLPQFTITGAAGGAATKFPWLFRSGGPFWNLIGDVTQPVFAGGTLLHTKRAADQALLQAAAQYQNAVITAYQNVADTLHAMLADADALAADIEAERAAKVTLDLTHERMQDGYTDYLTDLAAEMAYQQAFSAGCRRRRLGSAIPRRSIRRSAAAGGIALRRSPRAKAWALVLPSPPRIDGVAMVSPNKTFYASRMMRRRPR